MNGDATSRIEEIILNGYNFRFGEYIGKGFDILQKNLGGFILFSLVSAILVVVVMMVPVIGILADIFVIFPALLAGVYLVAHQLNRGQSNEFGDFFKGFNYTGQLVLVALATFVINLLVSIPYFIIVAKSGLFDWYAEVLQNPTEISTPPEVPGWAFLLQLPSIYIGIAYSWAYMFVLFYNMSFWNAMEASRRIITKKWFMVFLFSIVIGLIAVAGALLFCIGMLVTVPAVLCMSYAAFADVTQLGKEADGGGGDMIERHLVE